MLAYSAKAYPSPEMAIKASTCTYILPTYTLPTLGLYSLPDMESLHYHIKY